MGDSTQRTFTWYVAPGVGSKRTTARPAVLVASAVSCARPIVRLPVDEHDLRVGRESVQHLGAQDAVLAVARLEIVILAEGARRDGFRQPLAEELAVVAIAAIENGDLDLLSASAALMPGL